MQVTELIIDNIMKIRAIHIRPKSNVVALKGENGNGKSSVLNALVMGFKGKKEFPDSPIRKGAKKGSIKISVDGDDTVPSFTVTQTITEKSTNLMIEPDTVLFGDTPRSFLDKLIGKISFDPLAFINQEGKKQRTALLELIGVDVDALDKKEKGIYDERTAIGRDLKTAQARVKNLSVWPDVKETEEIKVGEFSVKIQAAIKHNNEIDNRIEDNNTRKSNVIEAREKIKEYEQEIATLEKYIVETKAEYTKEKEALDKLKPIDIDDLNTQLSAISDTNSKIRDNIAYKKESVVLKSVQSEYDKLDKALDTVREERVTLIQAADIPVPGLTFDEDGLLYNDIPLSQCSDGEKLMVSMGISMALNPTVRVLLIKDGSLLDGKNRAILNKMCKDRGFQLWMESVASKDEYDAAGKVGIWIEEGVAEGDGVVESESEAVAEPKKTSKKKATTEPVVESNAEPDDDW
jgi:hypothetical protein